MRAAARSALLAAILTGCGDTIPGSSISNFMEPRSSRVASVVVSPQTFLLAAGDTVRLVAATRDNVGGALAGRFVSWTTENADVATVSATGLVTARVAGRSVRITATSEGVSGAATITTN
jgi:uncharacterized protein YjdB